MSTSAARPADSVDPAGIRAVLLLRPRFLGDVCLTLPTLDAVRAAAPLARVGYVVEEEAAPLLAGDPRVDDLIVAPRRGNALALVRTAARIRRFRADVVLDLFCNPRTALWALLAGAPVRVGYPGKGWRSAAYTHHVRPRTLSAIGFHLASVARLGWDAPVAVPRLHIAPEEAARAETALRRAGVPPGSRLVGFHPGARWPTRRWDPDRHAELAGRFLQSDPAGVALITGGEADRALVAQVADALPARRAVTAIGWPIARFVALQAACAAFVSGDTGPLHTSVAAGTPTLGLMSRNSPAMFFPYPETSGHRAYYARVECSPCHRDECGDLRCLHRLTVEGAWRLLSGMLAGAA